jgi:hypothetical protein
MLDTAGCYGSCSGGLGSARRGLGEGIFVFVGSGVCRYTRYGLGDGIFVLPAER